jgi:hypothetical protein
MDVDVDDLDLGVGADVAFSHFDVHRASSVMGALIAGIVVPAASLTHDRELFDSP